MSSTVSVLRITLREHADEAIQEASKRFFKEGQRVQCYGLKAATVKSIAKKWRRTLATISKKEIFDICEELWCSGYLEESSTACDLAYSQRQKFEPGDFELFEYWVENHVKNWAACDMLCNHTIGDFVVMYPNYIERLKAWTASSNLWKRRAAAVTLVIPARAGLFFQIY